MTSATDLAKPYERVPLAEEMNAFPLWLEAVEWNVEMEEPEEEKPAEDGPAESEAAEDDAAEEGAAACGLGGCGRPWEDELPGLPAGEEGERLRALIEQNRRTLELVDAGIERGRLQFPEIDAERFSAGLEIKPVLGNLSTVRFLRIRQLAGEGEYEQAAGDALRLLQVGDLVCHGEGIVIHYMCGACVRREALSAMLFLVKQDPPEEVLALLLAGVERSLAEGDGLAEALRVDYWRTARPMIERVPDGGSVEGLVDHLLGALYFHGPSMLDADAIVDVDDRAAWRRRCLLAVLEDHPCPFDKRATFQAGQEQLRDAVASITAAPVPSPLDLRATIRTRMLHQRQRRRNSQCAVFPWQLSPGCPFEFLGESEEAKQKLAEFRGLLDDARHQNLCRRVTLATIEELRRQVHSVRNPLGALLLAHAGVSTVAEPVMRNARAKLAATKALLALAIYRTRRGRLPGTLGELIKERVIDSLPEDPYSGRPLQYDPRQAAVWCVGPSGVNRRGGLEHAPYTPGIKLRWELPSAPARA